MTSPNSRRNGLVLLLIIALFVGAFLLLSNRPDEKEQAIDHGRPLESPSATDPTANADRRPRATESATAAVVDPLATGTFPGLGVQPGMLGASDISSLPEHDLTISISSAAPIGQIAYVIPTNAEHDQGQHVEYGRSWSISMKVYGSPDYAAVFTQASYRGDAITTTITIDGRVTERCVSRGPYSVSWCQG